MRIATIVGARPQFIKASVVSRALAKLPDVDEVLIHTGQHYDENMSQVFFDELEIRPPDHNLEVGSAPQAIQIAEMMRRLDPLLDELRPGLVLIYGDTSSTLAGALTAAKRGIAVAHVEAGLRSFNRAMQEEINRVVADHLSKLLFAPTDAAVRNLAREGIDAASIHLVGDVMYDVSLHYASAARAKSTILETLGLAPKSFVLATIHRAENTDDPARLRAIVEGLAIAARALPVVVPLHPRTKRALDVPVDSLRIIEPVGYLDMLRLEESAAVIATDSGGVQKEAYFHRVPCVTLRDETEWVELVDLGWNRICPPVSANAIGAAVVDAIGRIGEENREPYGDGNAATRIARLLRGEP